jgi:hypothetical protein
MNDTNNEQAVSLTEALNIQGIPLSAVAAGKILLVAGITEVRWRPSGKADRPPKSYKAATSPLGESLGAVNEVNTIGSGDPTSLRFDRHRFASLWASKPVQEALGELLEASDVRYREQAVSQRSEIF